MRILIVNIYFHPDPTGTGLVITELARDLAANGHAITVITSVSHYAGVLPSATSRRAWTEEYLDGIRVLRTAVYVPRRKTFWARTVNYLSFSVLALAAGLRVGPQEIILCISPPLLLGASISALSWLKRVPFVFNVQDIYPDAAVLMGMLRSPMVIALSRRLERLVYGRAALVTVISKSAKQNLRAKGVPEAKIAVIENWVDTDFIRPLPADNDFRRSLVQAFGRSGVQAFRRSSDPSDLNARTPERLNACPSSKVVMFAGNIGLIAGLETVLDAAAALRQRSDIQFVIVGEGNAKADLVARTGVMELANVTFLPTQPRANLPEVLAAADLHLVTLKRRMSATSVPSKSYAIMASSRPMVAAVDPGSEVWLRVEEAGAGLCVLPEEPAELARAIETLCDDPERRRCMGERARAAVVRRNDRRSLTAQYGQTLELVAQKVRGRGEGSGVVADPLPTPDP